MSSKSSLRKRLFPASKANLNNAVDEIKKI